MNRPTIDDTTFDAALAAVPAPPGYSWQFDAAASGDRVRLFPDAGGHIGVVYGSGAWGVDEPDGYGVAARGSEPSLIDGMRRMLRVAIALGTMPGEDNEP